MRTHTLTGPSQTIMTFVKWIWCDTALLLYPNIKCTFWSTCLAIAKMRAGKMYCIEEGSLWKFFFLIFFIVIFYLDLYILDWQCWNVLKCSETLNKMVYNKLYHLYIYLHKHTNIYMCIYNYIYVYTFYNMAVLKKFTHFSKENIGL